MLYTINPVSFHWRLQSFYKKITIFDIKIGEGSFIRALASTGANMVYFTLLH